MKHWSSILLCAHISLCMMAPTWGQAPINILSVQQGLPRSQIYDIVQDTFGFIWLGTRDGLVKYDGFSCEVFRAGDHGMPFNYVYDLFIDSKNRLWMSSNADYRGVAHYDLGTKEFHHVNVANFPTLSNDGIVCISEDINGNMALLTKNFELNIFDEELGTFTVFKLSDYLPDKREIVNIGDMIADPYSDGVFWINTFEGLFRFSTVEEKITDLLYPMGCTPVRFFHLDGDKYLWTSLSQKGGLLRIGLEEPYPKMLYTPDTSFQVSSNLDTRGLLDFSVYDMAMKSGHELYLGTINRGVGTFNLKNDHFDFSQHQSKILDTDFIRTLYSNKKGEQWVGADITGLFYLRPESAHFKTRLFLEQNEKESRFRMSDIYQLDDSLYLMTFYRFPQVWVWNRNTDTFNKIDLAVKSRYGDNIIQYREKILIGCSSNGIDEFSASSNRLRNNIFDLPSDFSYINKMIADSSGIWFIHWGSGLGHYQDSLTQFIGGKNGTLKHTWTHDIAFGPDNKVWIGQENGLYSIDKYSHQINTFAHREELQPFDNPNFKALEFDQSGRLWIGNFGTGVSCFDIKNRQVLYKINAKVGLPSDRVYDMICDNAGFMWVWTSDGLCSFDTKKDFSNIKVKYYPESKYLPVDRLGIWFTKLPNGEIFFGVAGGFVSFDPEQLRLDQEEYLNPPVLTDFKVLDKSISFTQQTVYDSPIDLRPKQNFFSIAFSAPKSGFLSRQQFNYRLAGVDQDWVNSATGRVATYTDIAPGTYEFYTRVGNQNGSWSAASNKLSIIVHAPWYATNMAKFLWMLLGISFVYALNRIFIIRERMTAQLKMQRIEAQNLRKINEVKSSFFTQISHEFRTPLTVILGMVDLLKSQINGEPIIRQKISAIERNGKQLLKQINQILDLSKLQSKSVSLALIQGNIVLYLKYLTQSFVTYAESKKIQLIFSSTSDKIIMDYDPERIRDVFSNLISNAIKFTPANGEIKVVAAESIEKDRSFLELSISDTGTGISEEDISHIFEPYYQGNNRNKSLGTGLGLATTRQWINAMGGQIQVNSSLNKGTAFTISLPVTNSAPTSELSLRKNDLIDDLSVTPWELTMTDQHQERSTILLIEDHIDVANYLRLCLSEFEIIHATDGEQGIKIAIKEVPDLIITDIMMPIKDGYEVCALLRSHETTSHVPIIMLTAKATQEEKRQGLSLGADAYLTKPFDQKELMIRVNGLLSQRRLLQEKYSQRFAKSTSQPDDVEDQFLDQIQLFVESHLDHDFSVEDVAAALKMSRVQLYRKVKALTGRSASLYIRLIRLYKARQILLSTHKNVTEVAYETGFSDASYFSRVFKEEFSVSPSDVKRDPGA